MEKLIQFIESRFDYCQKAKDLKVKENHYAQAYGAISFYSMEHPQNEEALCSLWNTWQMKFISEIYGWKA